MNASPKIKLPSYHSGQAKWFNRKERFIVVAAGTKAGKTFGAILWLLREAFSKPGKIYWWVAPVSGQSRIAYKLALKILRAIKNGDKRLPIRTVKSPEPEITLPNGSIIAFRSADKADSLFGEGVNAAVFDEASRAKEDSWHAVRTTLTFTHGRCLLIANAKGKRNFFYKLYLHGRDSQYSNYFSCRQPSSSNPWLDSAEINDARSVLPDSAFRELYLAEFLDESAGVFAGWSDCIAGKLERPRPNTNYIIGADFGRKKDWSVFTVLDTNRSHVVNQHRSQLPWSSQIKTLSNLSIEYNDAIIYADATGIGDPIVDRLIESDTWVEPIIFSPKIKNELILRMQGVIQREEITIPDSLTVLKDELDIFTYNVTSSGNVSYSAPDGHHDDCVVSLALAIYGMSQDAGVIA